MTEITDKAEKKRIYNKNRYNKLKNTTKLEAEPAEKPVKITTKLEAEPADNINKITTKLEAEPAENDENEEIELNMDDIIKLIDERINLYLKNNVCISNTDINKVMSEQKIDKSTFFFKPEMMTGLIQTVMISLLPVVLRLLSNQFTKKEEKPKTELPLFILE